MQMPIGKIAIKAINPIVILTFGTYIFWLALELVSRSDFCSCISCNVEWFPVGAFALSLISLGSGRAVVSSVKCVMAMRGEIATPDGAIWELVIDVAMLVLGFALAVMFVAIGFLRANPNAII